MKPGSSCEVCGYVPLSPLFKKDGFQYEKCPECGLIRIHPQPNDNTLETIYQNDYFAAWGKSEDVFRSLKRKTFAAILNMVPQDKRGGKLLDVGAASGILMDLAQEWGYQSFGVEVAKDCAAAIMQKFGADHVFTGYFDQIDFSATNLVGVFDVVTMIDLLEHVRDPNAALAQAYSLLKPKGYLLLCAPDTASWTARIFGKKWNLYVPEHLFSFSKECLSQILRKRNYRICRMEAAKKYMTAEYFHNHLIRYPGSVGFLRPFLSLIPAPLKRIPIPLYTGQMKVLAQKDAG